MLTPPSRTTSILKERREKKIRSRRGQQPAITGAYFRMPGPVIICYDTDQLEEIRLASQAALLS